MSAVFSALETSSNGLSTYQTWLDAIADNIANANTVRPFDEGAFQARYIHASAVDYGNAGAAGIGNGSQVDGVLFGKAEGQLVYDPDHPYANDEGYIRMPAVDMGEQMTDMIVAQRAFQANVAAVERARNTYEAALRIGR